jgi:RHS repeat-associated protein
VRYFLADVQGSTRLLSDATGAITSSYDYSAFGELTDSPSVETKYLYTGQQYDAATAMYSLRARYYAPGAGRFVSRDVWPVDFGDPWELNRYGYVGNNPGNYSDPSGWASATLELGGTTQVATGGPGGGALRRLLGGLIGATAGAIVGGLLAAARYSLTRLGLCGVDQITQSHGNYIMQGVAIGGLVGFITGLIAAGLTPAEAAVAGVTISLAQFVQGPNACTLLDLAFAIATLGLSGGSNSASGGALAPVGGGSTGDGMVAAAALTLEILLIQSGVLSLSTTPSGNVEDDDGGEQNQDDIMPELTNFDDLGELRIEQDRSLLPKIPLSQNLRERAYVYLVGLIGRNGSLEQIGIYDVDGNVIYHIDFPDSSTPFWHYHIITTPGNPASGHGAGAPHVRIGNGTIQAVIDFLRSRGLMDYQLSQLRLIP